MSRIKNTFTYKIPDDYVEQTNVNDSSASFTYRGPQYLELTTNKTTNIVTGASEASFEEFANQAGDNTIIISHYDYPVETAILWGNLSLDSSDQDSAAFPHKTINLPDGGDDHVFKYPWPPLPWKAFEASTMQYDPNTRTFGTMQWHQPWSNWGMIGQQVESIIAKSDEQIAAIDAADSIDTDLRQQWVNYKAEAEAKINLYQSNNLKAHQVSFTRAPDYEAPAVYTEDSA
jgi:hypothetical protein|tara:strand:- start:4494 stop:5186 length:693 start_codon:yes stop_codon:yes gene_type:complete